MDLFTFTEEILNGKLHSCAVLIIASVFQFCVGKHRNKMKILPFSFAADRKNSFSCDASTPSRNATARNKWFKIIISGYDY